MFARGIGCTIQLGEPIPENIYTNHLEIEQIGAGDGIRTRDINLGKVALYQLSYSRLPDTSHCPSRLGRVSTIGVVVPTKTCRK